MERRAVGFACVSFTSREYDTSTIQNFQAYQHRMMGICMEASLHDHFRTQKVPDCKGVAEKIA